jgi:hypothetical protein
MWIILDDDWGIGGRDDATKGIWRRDVWSRRRIGIMYESIFWELF